MKGITFDMTTHLLCAIPYPSSKRFEDTERGKRRTQREHNTKRSIKTMQLVTHRRKACFAGLAQMGIAVAAILGCHRLVVVHKLSNLVRLVRGFLHPPQLLAEILQLEVAHMRQASPDSQPAAPVPNQLPRASRGVVCPTTKQLFRGAHAHKLTT